MQKNALIQHASSLCGPWSPVSIGLQGRRTYVFHPVAHQDNSYIRALNRLLRAELVAVRLYQETELQKYQELPLASFMEDHRTSAASITRLVLINAGLPSKAPRALQAEFTMLLTKIASSFPHWLSHGSSPAALQYWEQRLMDRYEDVLTMAPVRDRRMLDLLAGRIEAHLQQMIP